MMNGRRSRPLRRDDVTFVLLAGALVFVLWSLRGVAILVAFALLLAYVLDPVVRALERIPLPRGARPPRPLCALLVIAALVGLLGWLAVIATPVLAAEFAGFLGRLPSLVDTIAGYVRARIADTSWNPQLERAMAGMRANAYSSLPQMGGAALRWLGGLFSRLNQVVGLAVLPVLTFYLLADRDHVRDSTLRFLPNGVRESIVRAEPAVDRALLSYVRGQGLVCLTMGTATGALLAMIGVPNPLFLGVLAGLGEALPLLGAFMTALAIGLSGFSVDLWHGIAGLAVYTLNNWLNGTFITPRVMERYLEIHPFVVIVSVLAGAQLLGPPGALLALPMAAVTQALVEDFGRRSASGSDGEPR